MIRLNKKRPLEDTPLSSLEYRNIRAAVDLLDQAVLKWHRGVWQMVSTTAKNPNVRGCINGIGITGAKVGQAFLVTLSRDGHSVSLLGSHVRSAKDWSPRHPCGIHTIDASPKVAADMLEDVAALIMAVPELLKPRNDLIVNAISEV